MDLLGLFANQAAIALDLTLKSRRARQALDGADPALAALARVAARLDELGTDATAGRRLLEALADALGPAGGGDEPPVRRRRRS